MPTDNVDKAVAWDAAQASWQKGYARAKAESVDTIESLRAEVSRLSAELEGARKKHFEEAARIADDPYNHITQEWPTIEQICEGIAAAIRQKGETP